MKENDIEVLRQIVSRTDKTGNEKVEMLVEFVEQHLKNCNLQNVSNRRELLIAYGKWIHTLAGESNTELATRLADRYLESN